MLRRRPVDKALGKERRYRPSIWIPTALSLVARYDGHAAGCIGFRRLSPAIPELTRMSY
jgi:hypothetical protein